jgi:TRAP-type C4-dicarboxylate transport system permease small subunit
LSRSGEHPWARRLERFGRSLETWLIVLLLGGLIVFATLQIVLRNFFSVGFTWGDGLVRLAVLWLALLGGVAASREGRHITMNALTRWLSPGLAKAAAVTADLVAAGVIGTLAWYALAFVRDSHEFGDTLLGDVPAWWLQAPMPLAFAVIAYRFMRRGIARLLGLAPTAREIP